MIVAHPLFDMIAEHIEKNWEAYSAIVGAVGIATIVTMPAKFPRSIDDLWSWLRNSLQTAIPARHAPPANDPPNPTPPVDPAKTGETK